MFNNNRFFERDSRKVEVLLEFDYKPFLTCDAALLVKSNLGVAVTLDKLLNVTAHSDLVFRSLEPRLEPGLDVVWKKYQVFSAAAERFLSRSQEQLQK